MPDDITEDQQLEFSSASGTTGRHPILQTADVKQVSALADWPVWLVAGTTFLSGLAGVVQPLLLRFAKHPKLFSAIVPYELYHFSKSITIAFSLLLIYLSFNLFKKKRAAWMLSLLINGLSALIQILRIGSEHSSWLASRLQDVDVPTYSAMPAVLACVFLIVLRKRFKVKSELRSIRSAVVVSLVLLAVTIGYGTLGFWLLDKIDFGVNFDLQSCFTRTISEISHFGNPDISARTRYAQWFIESLQLFGFITPAFISYSLFRPINYQLNTLPKERQLAETILNAHGRTSLDRYKLLSDKSYFFSADNTCFIAYKTELSIAICLGDPNGPAELLPAFTQQFLNFCHENGWACAFMQVPADFLEMYEALKLDVLKVGEDAVVELEKFCKDVVTKKTFKAPTRKLDKEGYKVVKVSPALSDEELGVLKEVSDEWLSLPGRRERGFSLGKFDREELKRDCIFKLLNPQGKTLAFVNQVRSYRAGETTIDLMRHRVQVPNGAMDFLFVKLLSMLKDEGYQCFSLGLAALSGVGTESDATLQERAVHQIYEHMNRFFSYKGLRNYKAKFEPIWEPRYLVYQGGTPGLVKTALAIAKATED